MPELICSPAAERNKEPILQVLQRVLPERGRVLEVASGSGQHLVHFASALPALHWLPSEPDHQGRQSIRARVADAGLANVDEPITLDVTATWPALEIAAVIVANLLHISEPAALPGLMRGAASVLPRGGVLTVYGPFKRNGEQVSLSNAEFDHSLRTRNALWGIRDMERVIEEAQSCSLRLLEVVAMPANNFMLIFTSDAIAQ
jgi:hypothetical protein